MRGSAHDILQGPEDRFIYGESPVCRRGVADSLHAVRVYTLQVGQTIVFCGLSGSSSNGDRRHKPIVRPTSDLADSARMYKTQATGREACPTRRQERARTASALVELFKNSNRRIHSLKTSLPPTFVGLNFQRRAACNARLAKYVLGPAEARFASTTLPDGSTRTLTLTLTLP